MRVAEGNYLLLDYYPWSQLKELFDERWFVQVDVAEAMQVRVCRSANCLGWGALG